VSETVSGRRTLLVEIPDDDSAARTVRYVAEQLRDSQDIIVLDYCGALLTQKQVQTIVARMTAYLRIQEGKAVRDPAVLSALREEIDPEVYDQLLAALQTGISN
jgi:hypothetical protein